MGGDPRVAGRRTPVAYVFDLERTGRRQHLVVERDAARAMAGQAANTCRTKRGGRHPQKALSAAFVPSAPPGRHADGNSLYLRYAISISSWQWSLGPQRSGEFNARTVRESLRPSEAKTKSNWRVAVVGVWRFVW